MNSQEKMFYTPSEACTYLGTKEDVLNRWMNRLHMQTRKLPKVKGVFLARRDVLLIQENMGYPNIFI